MKRKQDLFDLISAMSKSEKRYFTLDAQKSGKKDAKYLELFKAINGMNEYDEAKLKKKFPKNLSADKAYLYDAILRSMRDYRSAKSISAQIKEMILDAKYLYERGLYDQSEDRLNEARELAKSIDDQIALLEINQEERALALVNEKDYASRFQDLIDDKDSAIKSLFDYFKYYDLSTQLIIGRSKGFYGNKGDYLSEIQSKIEFDKAPFYPRALQKYNFTLATFYRFSNELLKAKEFYSEVVEIWEQNPTFKQEEPFRYVHDINNLLGILGYLDEVEKFPELIENLESLSELSNQIASSTFYIIYIHKLMYFINTGVDHDVERLVKKIEEGLSVNKIYVARQVALMLNATILLFVNARFELSYEWSKNLIKKIKSANQVNGLWACSLIRLISAYEFMDPEELDKELRFIDRLFSSELTENNKVVLTETLELIKQIINSPILEVNKNLKSLKEFIELNRQNGRNALPQGTDEMILWWINSKLFRKSMTAVIAGIRQKQLENVEV